MLVALLSACVAPDGPPAETGALDSADSAEDTALACELGAITVTGAPEPGATVVLEVGGVHAAWTVSAGTLSAESGAAVEWTLPVDIAADEPEELSVTAAACGDTVDAEVEADWSLAARTVVLYNPSVAGSEDVARYYATFRGIPDTALCAVESPDATTLDGADFDAYAADVQACIDAVGPHVWFLAPVYGVPYKVSGRVTDLAGTGAIATVSLDALLFYGAAGAELSEPQYNPVYRDGDSTTYTWDDSRTFGKARKRLDDPVYAVSRIDGADADAAMALVDRTAAAEELAAGGALDGIVYVDGRYGDAEPDPAAGFGSYEWGEWNMWGTRHVFESLGAYEVVWDGNEAEFGTDPAPTTCPDALFYAGWYSYYNYNDAFSWAPGAVGGHLDSCSACDLRDGTWSAEALQRGITATFGAVNEPYVAGMPEYDQLFLYLAQGATFGEAAYESTVVGAWMMVFVGDPLYRPFPEAG